MAPTPIPPVRALERKPPTPIPVVVVRCWACGRILGEFAPGCVVRLKCGSCNTWHVIDTRGA